MFAYIDYNIPMLFNEKSIMLLIAFSVMAFSVSPLSPLERRAQERVVACYLPAIFAWWLLFQFPFWLGGIPAVISFQAIKSIVLLG